MVFYFCKANVFVKNHLSFVFYKNYQVISAKPFILMIKQNVIFTLN